MTASGPWGQPQPIRLTLVSPLPVTFRYLITPRMPKRPIRCFHVRRLAGALLMSTQVLACTRWHTEKVAPAPFIAEKHPARVRLLLSDGTNPELTRPAIIGDSVVGTYQRFAKPAPPGASPYASGARSASHSARRAFALTDIQQVAVRKTSADRTVLLVGVLLAGVAAFLIAAAASLSDIPFGG